MSQSTLSSRRGIQRAGLPGKETTMRRVQLSALVVIVAIFALAGADQAWSASVSWVLAPGLSGDWQTASNWSSLSVPGSGDIAYVDNGGTVTVSGSTQTCGNLTLGDTNGSGNVQMTGGSLAGGTDFVGASGAGSFAQTGGTAGAGYLWLGYGSGSSGTYNLSGGSLLVSYSIVGGASAIGSFTQSGGTATAGNLYLGGFPYSGLASGSGTYNLSGSGLLSAGNEQVGIVGSLFSGTGSFTQSGGTNSVSQQLNVHGFSVGGSYNLSGGYLNTGAITVGEYGTGTFNQSGGTVNTGASGGLYLGGYQQSSGSSGTYSLSGGSLYSSQEYVGYAARNSQNFSAGTFIQSGGTNSVGTSHLAGSLYVSDATSPPLGPNLSDSGSYYLKGGILSVAYGTEYCRKHVRSWQLHTDRRDQHRRLAWHRLAFPRLHLQP